MYWDRLYELDKNVSFKLSHSGKFEVNGSQTQGRHIISNDVLFILRLFVGQDLPRNVFQKLMHADSKWEGLSESQFENILDDLVQKGLLRGLPISTTEQVSGFGGPEIICSNWNAVKLNVWGTGAPSECVEVGKFCNFADGVQFLLGGQHNPDAVSHFRVSAHFSEDFDPKNETAMIRDGRFDKIVIQNEVWIGLNATIMGGVRIGNGAVIGANSHVMEDVPDFAIVAGNPAKILRYRFSRSVIEKLLDIKWWDWSEEKIRQEAKSFDLPVEEFVEKYATTKPSTTKPKKPLSSKSESHAELICAFLQAKSPQRETPLSVETNLFDAGVLTSLRFFELITFLEEKFKISVALEEVEKKSFESAGAIADYVKRKTKT